MKPDAINYKNIFARPDLLAKIISIDEDSERCFFEMDKLIRSDQGTVTFILRVANSAMYSRGKQIKTIPHAISLLGIKIIRSLAVLSVARVIFKRQKNQLFQKHVWQHSLLTALACQEICATMSESTLVEEAFVAGLLHDIGKVLLFYNFPDDYPAILRYVLEHTCSCTYAEQKFLEIDHNDVGKQAVIEWELPKYFGDYTGTNLDSMLSDHTENKVISFLAIANRLIKGAGYGAQLLKPDARKEKLIECGASEELCDTLLEETFLRKLLKHDLYRASL